MGLSFYYELMEGRSSARISLLLAQNVLFKCFFFFFALHHTTPHPLAMPTLEFLLFPMTYSVSIFHNHHPPYLRRVMLSPIPHFNSLVQVLSSEL